MRNAKNFQTNPATNEKKKQNNNNNTIISRNKTSIEFILNSCRSLTTHRMIEIAVLLAMSALWIGKCVWLTRWLAGWLLIFGTNIATLREKIFHIRTRDRQHNIVGCTALIIIVIRLIINSKFCSTTTTKKRARDYCRHRHCCTGMLLLLNRLRWCSYILLSPSAVRYVFGYG